jgi:hypothetical protein
MTCGQSRSSSNHSDEAAAKAAYLAGLLSASGWDNYRRIIDFMAGGAEGLVPRCAWYLTIIGVHPASQGHGMWSMTVEALTRRVGRALPWLLIFYAAASLLHFVHNAEHLAEYPNLPPSWSRGDVYGAWCVVTLLGVVGYLLDCRGQRRVGLTLLFLYAGLGFGGLLHYTRATVAHHSAMMNATIWTEAGAAALLLMSLGAVASQAARPNGA